MIIYHATTPAKVKRYCATGAILPPVRGWAFLTSAQAWAKRVGRSVVLRLDADVAYPPPDHQPRGHAYWSPNVIRSWSREATK